MRPLIGYNYGARQHARVKKLYELTLIMSAAIMAAGTLICLFASRPLMQLFTSNPETIAIGQTALRIICLGFVVSAVSTTSSGALEGLGKGVPSLVISLCRYVVFIMPLAAACGIEIKPIDSEHSAIWQSLTGEPHDAIEKILLTASGGPFRGKKRDELRGKTKEDALKHPNWSMGRKITIDSATMVNKGLEVLEASWLFDVPVDEIQVVVQPQSIVHSAVQYVDGSVKAQLGLPDMRIPIEYALYAPNRRALKEDERLDLAALMQLTFENPDMETFKGLALGYRAGRTGGSMPTVYNAANEEAVAMFLQDRIDFLEIADVIEEAMDAHEGHVLAAPTLEEILEIEAWARDFVRTHSQIVRV